MKYTIETATAKAHEMYVYESSEKSDEKAMEYPFDGVWQSMYDVCKLVKLGILDDVEDDEFEEAKEFLIETQQLTHDYKEFEMEL